jgi:uncharacterized membrane protein YbhN (UPF0104 family)
VINKTVRTILKVALSAAAIYYVATSLDFCLIKEAILSSRPALLVAALVLYAASQVAAAYRLNRLFRQVPLYISQLENFKLYWLGLFYNLFLPGGVGGDGFKVYLLGKYLKAPIKKIIGVILSDRVSGLSVILVFLLLLFPFIDYNFSLQKWAWTLIPFVLLGFYLFLRFFNRSLIPAIIPVTGWAFVTQILQMGAAIMILQSLGVKLDGVYQNYLFLFFLSAIMGAIPITLGGIGAREITFLFGANYLGIDQTYAVSLSILFYAASAITALPGIIYTINPADILKDK